MKAFANLRGNANFATVLKFIKDCVDRTDDEGREVPEEYKLRWNQGATRDLNEILKLAEMSKRL
jgi:hypothetical protein